jgi:hypothetical protein
MGSFEFLSFTTPANSAGYAQKENTINVMSNGILFILIFATAMQV